MDTDICPSRPAYRYLELRRRVSDCEGKYVLWLYLDRRRSYTALQSIMAKRAAEWVVFFASDTALFPDHSDADELPNWSIPRVSKCINVKLNTYSWRLFVAVRIGQVGGLLSLCMLEERKIQPCLTRQ